LPGFVVDAVAEVPFGAHPTSFFPRYGYDAAFHRAWVAVARHDEEAERFIRQHLIEPADQAEYLELVGGASMLISIRQWERV